MEWRIKINILKGIHIPFNYYKGLKRDCREAFNGLNTMKHAIICLNDKFGGALWLRHISKALQELGEGVSHFGIDEDTSQYDYTWVQSEWIEKQSYLTAKHPIVLLGHFTDTVYPPPWNIRGTILTQWTGKVVEEYEKRTGLKTHYFPHAYPHYDDMFKRDEDSVWFGTANKWRDNNWLEGLPIKHLKGEPEDVSAYYKRSKVLPNLHLNVQMGYVDQSQDSMIDYEGYSLNERTFWICGVGGGVQITDNPLVREFYGEDEVALATTKEEYHKLFYKLLRDKERRKSMSEKAKRTTEEKHTYKHRVKQVMEILCQDQNK